MVFQHRMIYQWIKLLLLVRCQNDQMPRDQRQMSQPTQVGASNWQPSQHHQLLDLHPKGLKMGCISLLKEWKTNNSSRCFGTFFPGDIWSKESHTAKAVQVPWKHDEVWFHHVCVIFVLLLTPPQPQPAKKRLTHVKAKITASRLVSLSTC